MSDITDTFHQSYVRCTSVPIFLDLFYERFIYSSDEIAKKFASTEFRRQKTILALSFKMLMRSYDGDEAADDYLHFLADRHSVSDLDIDPEFYELWLDALLSTVEQTDPQYSPEIEKAWRTVMQYGIDVMISAYEKP